MEKLDSLDVEYSLAHIQQSPKEGKIYEAIAKIMEAVEPIIKDSTNTAQGYKYRSIDSVYNSLHRLFAKEGVFTTAHVLSRERSDFKTTKGSIHTHVTIAVKFRFTARDGSYVEAGPIFSEAIDSGDKASIKALAHAHKYALMQTLMIPTDDPKDIDADSPGEEEQLATEKQIKYALTLLDRQQISPSESFEIVKSINSDKSSIKELNTKEMSQYIEKIKSFEKEELGDIP